jgi:hypothetical protein
MGLLPPQLIATGAGDIHLSAAVRQNQMQDIQRHRGALAEIDIPMLRPVDLHLRSRRHLHPPKRPQRRPTQALAHILPDRLQRSAEIVRIHQVVMQLDGAGTAAMWQALAFGGPPRPGDRVQAGGFELKHLAAPVPRPAVDALLLFALMIADCRFIDVQEAADGSGRMSALGQSLDGHQIVLREFRHRAQLEPSAPGARLAGFDPGSVGDTRRWAAGPEFRG